MTEKLLRLRREIKERRPLVHCITNPISIQSCANVILAAGGRPIMAEHPEEAEEIVRGAGSLVLNLGNITDVRMDSMRRALAEARRNGIPVLLDLVGVSCSRLRLRFAQSLLEQGGCSIVKGNMSELLALAGRASHSVGVDAGEADALTPEGLPDRVKLFCALAGQTGAVILATGAKDLIVGSGRALLGENGTPMLAGITGTGCMAGALAGLYLNGGEPVEAALLAVTVLGTAGEAARDRARGPGSFQAELLDAVWGMSDGELASRGSFREIAAH